PNLGWTRLRIVDEMHDRLPDVDLPIHVENEANLAALAEHWQGAARGVRSFISVFGEVGVGAGIVVDGELYRGTHGFRGGVGPRAGWPGRGWGRRRAPRVPRGAGRGGGERPPRRPQNRLWQEDVEHHGGARAPRTLRRSRGARRLARCRYVARHRTRLCCQ